ncbi:N-lysine methyltransferase SMYD2 [Favolaschia claudopus]|uniref:N-lysine methyltransferase SMYD2 n=1 Tax=Favolaschia claudopus TaxID=2862362 RepID=A0AAW0DLJ7_9AGAR
MGEFECNAAECKEEGISQCARCKQRFYCGSECQLKDWPTHKQECKRLTTNAQTGPAPSSSPRPHFSPFGQMFHPDYPGGSIPMSMNTKFFDPMFGYTAQDPKRIYKELVNAYRLLRLNAHSNARSVSPELQNMEFKGWMERVMRVGMLPEWWDAEVNGAGIDEYAREDEWGRLDRVLSREEIKADAQMRLMSLEMMIERVMLNN